MEISIHIWWIIGRSQKISPNVQSGERSHPASMMSGVMRKVSTPIPRFKKLTMELIVASIGSTGFTGSAAHTFCIPPPTDIPPLLFTLSSPLVIKSPAQKTDRRASRESLERIWDWNISFYISEWDFCFLLLLHHIFLYFAKLLALTFGVFMTSPLLPQEYCPPEDCLHEPSGASPRVEREIRICEIWFPGEKKFLSLLWFRYN